MSRRGLKGKRVVVTRPEAQAASLCAKLTYAGAIPMACPTIRLEQVADVRPIHAALSRLDTYDWVVFTSVNGVRYAMAQMDHSWPDTARVAAIGPATRSALQSRGIHVSFMPKEYRAERIADGIDGQRVLLLRARGARPALRILLQKRGMEVNDVALYEAKNHTPPPAALHAIRNGVDVITFTSASTAKGYAQLQGVQTDAALVACIGPVTARAAEALGFTVQVVATDYTVQGLVDALEQYYG